MKFGPEPVATAGGTILAHTLRLGLSVIKKGRILDTADLAAIAAAGVAEVTVARLEPGDVGEDEAAARLGALIGGDGCIVQPAETGRVNVRAGSTGVLLFDPAAIDRVNEVAEDVTLATVARFAPVAAGDLIATIKIIPFAVSEHVLARALDEAHAARLEVRGFRPLAAHLVQTTAPGLKPSLLDKTKTVTEARLARLGARLVRETRCIHAVEALSTELAAIDGAVDIVLVVGASAIVDRRDVIPQAIERTGGRLIRLGMPVDPGNLILVAEAGGRPVLGLPGCARSPARNGFDWVLERLAAGLPVGNEEIARMGAGGFLIGQET
jgi:molybdenum cofactor cytidylyltransferase